MFCISRYDNSKHFIHKTNYDMLDDMINIKKLGFLDNNDQFYDVINKDDFIIFAIDINQNLNLFAYTKVDDVLFDDEELFGVYNSDKKLKFSRLKFFKEPISNSDFNIMPDFNYLKISNDEYQSIIPSKDKLGKSLLPSIKYHPNLTVCEFIQNTNDFIEENFGSNNKIPSEIVFDPNENMSLDFDDDSRLFIQHIDFNGLNLLERKMYINEVENKSEEIKQVKPNDYVLLFTTINDNRYFFAIGKVAYNLFNSFDNFKYFKPQNTIKFRTINYSSNICNTSELDFIEFNPDNQYFEISKKDTEKICKDIDFSNSFPTYFNKYDFGDVRKFIVDTGKKLFDLIKDAYDIEIFPIKEFLKLLCKLLNCYDFNISYDETERFFSKYALKFGFRLTSTRERDLIVELNIQGRKKEVTYIMMNKK